MQQLPSYYLPRPAFELTPAMRREFDQLFEQAIGAGSGDFIDYSCAAPKWQYLCYLGDHMEVVLHGSGDPDISEFEPRQSDDVQEFGNQNAVYAASDALWASYFAVIDRPGKVWSLINSCLRLIAPDGRCVPFYFFLVNADALPEWPWRTGTIYVLPRDSFEQQESTQQDRESAQLRSFSAVKPLAKISIEPEEFLFLEQVRGHDFAVLRERAERNPDGFPWLDE